MFTIPERVFTFARNQRSAWAGIRKFKVNLLKPAAGERFRAVGRVLRAGRTLSVCTAEVQAYQGGEETTIAVMQGTMMAVRDNAGLVG